MRTWTIGADPNCDIVVDLPTVSGRHCRLIESPTGFLLEDLQSTNGTYVNGRSISSAVPVTRTDVILLGSKVALPWPDLSAPTLAVPAEARAPEKIPASQTIERWHVAVAFCGAGLATLLVIYTFISSGSGKEKSGRTDAAASKNDSASGLADKSAVMADASTGNGGRPQMISGQADGSGTQPPAVPDLETIMKEQERNVVWVGYRLRDFAFPYASGWLVRPNQVVTTAATVADLEPLSKEGIEPIVWREGQILPVTAMWRHPAFETENPGSQVSMHANVGLLQLEKSLDSNGTVASADELAGLSATRSLLVIGFESELGENQPFDELKLRRLRHKAELMSSEVLASSSSRLYKLRAPTGKCWEGAAVMNERGHVVGVLGVLAREARMVPASQLSRLLEAADGKR